MDFQLRFRRVSQVDPSRRRKPVKRSGGRAVVRPGGGRAHGCLLARIKVVMGSIHSAAGLLAGSRRRQAPPDDGQHDGGMEGPLLLPLWTLHTAL